MESNLTARTAARARNNATWPLSLDEDSTSKTFPNGKTTRDLFLLLWSKFPSNKYTTSDSKTVVERYL